MLGPVIGRFSYVPGGRADAPVGTVTPDEEAPLTATMTVEDYLALDAGLHRHAELVNGMLIEVNPPHGRHQLMAANLLVALRAAAPAGHSVLQEWG